jgi:hypothetical protein
LFYRINLFKGYELLKNFYISSHNFSKFIILTMSNYSQKSSNAEVDPSGSSIDPRIKIENTMNSDFSEFYSDEDCYEEPIDEMFLQWEEEEDKKDERKAMIWETVSERVNRLYPDLAESWQKRINRKENCQYDDFMAPPSFSTDNEEEEEEEVVIYDNSKKYLREQSSSADDYVKAEKTRIWEEALAETFKLFPDMVKSWQYTAPEFLQELVRMVRMVTDCK